MYVYVAYSEYREKNDLSHITKQNKFCMQFFTLTLALVL